MTGASVHFKPVRSATHAVSHASREVPPSYLLPKEVSCGSVVVLDDLGTVAKVLEAKMAMASPQARGSKNFSPIWEGVVNLRQPAIRENPDNYRNECAETMRQWRKEYEELTGHKVLRIDVHLDEGHVKESGRPVLNAHAHVIADRTDEHGKVKLLRANDLRKLQTITATVTKLERGENSLKTGRKHLAHQAYRYLAEQGRLEAQNQVKEVYNFQEKMNKDVWAFHKEEKKALKDELDQVKREYAEERKRLIASGAATQADYQRLKSEHEATVGTLKELATKAKAEEARAVKAEKQAQEAQRAAQEAARGRTEAEGRAKETTRAKIEAEARAATSESELQRVKREVAALKEEVRDEKVGRLAESARATVMEEQANDWAQRFGDLKRDANQMLQMLDQLKLDQVQDLAPEIQHSNPPAAEPLQTLEEWLKEHPKVGRIPEDITGQYMGAIKDVMSLYDGEYSVVDTGRGRLLALPVKGAVGDWININFKAGVPQEPPAQTPAEEGKYKGPSL